MRLATGGALRDEAGPGTKSHVTQLLQDIVARLVSRRSVTGAAIALRDKDQMVCRKDQMVCRAANGATAPEQGALLDPRAGISGECIRTGTVLHCTDAQADPRVDAAACRRLGVRSIAAFPL